MMPIYKVEGIKKDGLQKYKVRINYFSSDGTKRQLTRVTFGSESARDLERELLNKIKDQNEKPVRGLTVQQLFDEYEIAKKPEIRECTFEKNKKEYRLYVQPTMAKVRIDKLTVPMLQKWKLTVEEKGLALKTKQYAYGIFRAILNYAVRMEYLSNNPLLKVGNFKESLSIKPDMKFYTADEFRIFISTARRLAEEQQVKKNILIEWDYYVFFNIAFYTGLRKGEIHALKWSDINGAFLYIRRSITQKLKGADRETSVKNKSSLRTIQMPLPLIRILEEHKKRQMQLEYFTDDFRVCGGERSLRDTTISNKNMKYAKLSGLDVIRIHDYRHSHVSLLANEGINIQEIARRLGHARVEMTWNTYSHLYPREEERAVEILNMVA